MNQVPSVVVTRHRNHKRDKCFFVVVTVGDLTAERGFFSRNTAYKWAAWALDNIDAAAAQTRAMKEAGMRQEMGVAA